MATAQDFFQVNAGMGVGKYSSISIGGQVDYWKRSSTNWLKGLTYQHQRYVLTGATDVPDLTENYHSLFVSAGYEAKVASWSSLVFTLGAGFTHTYNSEENHFGPAVYGQFFGLIHLGKRTSLMLPLLILPKSGLLCWLPTASSELFYKTELLPIGIRVQL